MTLPGLAPPPVVLFLLDVLEAVSVSLAGFSLDKANRLIAEKIVPSPACPWPGGPVSLGDGCSGSGAGNLKILPLPW
jgi:hypothetical protein